MYKADKLFYKSRNNPLKNQDLAILQYKIGLFDYFYVYYHKQETRRKTVRLTND